MARRLVLSGLVGGLLAASSWSVMAQEAQPAGGCSGFMCKLFGSKLDDRSAAAASAAAAPAAVDVADPAAPADAVTKSRPRKMVKPVPTITIAADKAEAARVEILAATLPRTRVHVVAVGRSADFSLMPALDGGAAAEKARLFTEQLHIVAGPGVHSLADLKNQVVSFGPDKSSGQAAARKAFAKLGVNVKETPLDLDNALDGIATGDVAAVVVLAPQPDRRLARLKTASGLHLVSWPEGAAMPDGAAAATIPGSAYPGLAKPGESIRAVGVEAALDASGRGATSPAAKAFLISLSQNSAALSRRGFDLIRADLETRNGRRVASAERR